MENVENVVVLQAQAYSPLSRLVGCMPMVRTESMQTDEIMTDMVAAMVYPIDYATLQTTAPRMFLAERTPALEASTDVRQLVTYNLLVVRSPAGPRVFSYRRASKGNEARLHGLMSLGVGGHLSASDVTQPAARLRMVLRAALRRELREELPWPDEVFSRVRECMFPDYMVAHADTPVGAAHIGIVMRVQVSLGAGLTLVDTDDRSELHWQGQRLPVCPELAEPRWLRYDELPALLPEMEVWSQFVARALLSEAATGIVL